MQVLQIKDIVQLLLVSKVLNTYNLINLLLLEVVVEAPVKVKIQLQLDLIVEISVKEQVQLLLVLLQVLTYKVIFQLPLEHSVHKQINKIIV